MIELSVRDQEFVNGTHGEAAALAMRILIRSAELMGAERLLDITSAHIDGCLYHGQASLDFVEFLLEKGGRVAVPTTLNVGSMDLIHPELFQGSEAQESQARKLMQAHIELGCESTFTCAPYQGKHRPVKGQQIAWAESNAIVFANSVLGARTNRYGDFLDLCAALTGRAPYSGLHLTENRYGQVLYELQDFPHQNDARDIWFAVLGLWVGGHVGNRIPVFSGLPLDTSEDELKALGASAAATGAVGLFHALGITPEATTLGDAFGGRDPTEVVPVSFKDLLQARQAMSATKAGDKLVAVSLGTPHFSLTEFNRLHQLLIAQNSKLAVDFYVNTSRFILWELEQTGLAQSMLNLGITIVTDTCTYITPIMRKSIGLVMTNSGKWAHYAPSTIGVQVAFGSLNECVLSAFKGEVVFNAN